MFNKEKPHAYITATTTRARTWKRRAGVSGQRQHHWVLRRPAGLDVAVLRRVRRGWHGWVSVCGAEPHGVPPPPAAHPPAAPPRHRTPGSPALMLRTGTTTRSVCRCPTYSPGPPREPGRGQQLPDGGGAHADPAADPGPPDCSQTRYARVRQYTGMVPLPCLSQVRSAVSNYNHFNVSQVESTSHPFALSKACCWNGGLLHLVLHQGDHHHQHHAP